MTAPIAITMSQVETLASGFVNKILSIRDALNDIDQFTAQDAAGKFVAVANTVSLGGGLKA